LLRKAIKMLCLLIKSNKIYDIWIVP